MQKESTKVTPSDVGLYVCFFAILVGIYWAGRTSREAIVSSVLFLMTSIAYWFVYRASIYGAVQKDS
jgi:uncharacterized MAPEG superfamily protein